MAISVVPGVAYPGDLTAHVAEHTDLGIVVPVGSTGLPSGGGIYPGLTAGAICASPAISAASGAAATYGWQHFAEAAFYGVRFKLRNYNSGTLAVTGMKCAPAATHLNDGALLTWTAVTFAGSTSGTIPAGSGATVDAVPGILVSDWINVKSIARTDTPANKPLLHTRVYLPTGAVIQNETSSVRHLSLFNDISNGRQIGAFVSSGDHVTSPGARTMTATGSYWSAGVEVEFMYVVPTLSILGVGDSLFKGANSSGFIAGMIARTAMILSDEYGIQASAAVYALSGQHSDATLATLRSLFVAGHRPDIVMLKNWTPNDGTASDAVMTLAFNRLQEEIALCRLYGARPFVVDSPPHGATTSNARRVAHNTLTYTLGVPVIRIAAGMEDPANLGHLLAAYDAGDDLHWTDAGHNYAGSQAAAEIARCIPLLEAA